MNSSDPRPNDVRRFAASVQAIAKILADLADSNRADFVIDAIRDPLIVRTAVERYDRAQRDVSVLQRHLAQMMDLREHVVPETDIYEHFKNIDEQIFPRLTVKISNRNMDRLEVVVSSRIVMLRLRALLCEHLLHDLWEWVPATVALLPGASAAIADQVKSAVREALVAAGRLFEGDLSTGIEQLIDQRIDALCGEVLRRIAGTRPSVSLDEVVERATRQCLDALAHDGYDVDGLAADLRTAAAKTADMVFEVARSGAVLTFPRDGVPYDAEVHDATDGASGPAVIADVTFPGLHRGDRTLQRPQVITAPANESSHPNHLERGERQP